MPTKTFLRLPEEKQARFIEAAWAEFSRVSYTETSINNIIKDAGISRGSFYQYFADKDDLFSYLLESVRLRFTGTYRRLLDECRGDLFQLQIAAYDRFLQRSSGDPFLERFIRILRTNPGFDLRKMIAEKPEQVLAEDLDSHLDVSMLRRQDAAFIRHVFSLSVMALCSAVMDSLIRPERSDAYRRELQARLEIIQYGSLKPASERPQ